MSEMIPAGTVMADWNANVPTESEYLVKARADNNAAAGVVLDLNQQRPEGPPVKPEEPPPEPPPDPQSIWVGDWQAGSYPGLPHSVYTEADLSFTDPEDHEEPYEALNELHTQLAAQVAEPASA